MEIQNQFLLITACIGLLNLTKFLLKLIRSIWKIFLRPPKDLKTYGAWALLTGSTDGIGKALASEMAARGLNLVLVGRNPAKLQSTSDEIKQNHSAVSIRTVVIDFSRCGGEEVARIVERETRALDLGIVVNNVGLAYPYARFFHETDAELVESVVRVNMEAMTWVTKAVVPRMMERKRGAIVNVGSGSAGFVPSYPLYSVYAATKAYVAMVSRSMSLEYKQHGIDVQCQIPFLVATKMASIKETSLFIPSPEAYSKASMRWMGHSDPICLPYWAHALLAWLLSLVPGPLFDWAIMKYFLGVRARGMRKDLKMGRLMGDKLVQDRFHKIS